MRAIFQIFSKRVFDSYRGVLGPNYNTPLGRWVGGEFYATTSTFDHCGDEKCGNVLELKKSLESGSSTRGSTRSTTTGISVTK
jgi:hypothetical protein